MIRVLSSACIVLALGLLGPVAWAGGKPPIAILGLEVYDNGTGIDPETTKAAKELTAALRDRAKVGSGPYTLVTNGDKELIDEKLLNNCDSEAASCMAAIGNELGAEVLMYGKIERSAQNGQAIYKVSIKLLNVNRKQLTSSTVETLPATESTGVKVSTHARAWYAKLAGGTSGGGVLIKANIDRGTVLVDDNVMGNLASGTLPLGGLSEGRHTLAIEAKDYQRYEVSITIRNGETLQHSATLTEMPRNKPVKLPPSDPISVEGTVASKPRSNAWKPIFYGTTLLEAGAVGYTLWQYKMATDAANRLPNANKSQDDCGKPNQGAILENACHHYKLYTIGWITSGVIGAAVVGSFFMAFIHDGDKGEKAVGSGHRKRRQIAVTPVLTPNGGGATLRFDW